jgi:hypothetical protein
MRPRHHYGEEYGKGFKKICKKEKISSGCFFTKHPLAARAVSSQPSLSEKDLELLLWALPKIDS